MYATYDFNLHSIVSYNSLEHTNNKTCYHSIIIIVLILIMGLFHIDIPRRA